MVVILTLFSNCYIAQTTLNCQDCPITYIILYRNTVRRLQEKECSFEASDPLEEAGEDLWDSAAFYIFDTFTNWVASFLHCGRRDEQ